MREAISLFARPSNTNETTRCSRLVNRLVPQDCGVVDSGLNAVCSCAWSSPTLPAITCGFLVPVRQQNRVCERLRKCQSGSDPTPLPHPLLP